MFSAVGSELANTATELHAALLRLHLQSSWMCGCSWRHAEPIDINNVCAAKSVHVCVGLVTVEQGGWSCPVPVLEPHHTFDGCVHAAQRPHHKEGWRVCFLRCEMLTLGSYAACFGLCIGSSWLCSLTPGQWGHCGPGTC